jgi:rod shape-determining protein MreC
MGDFFKSVKFKIILCILALLVGIMIYSVTQDGVSIASSNFLGSIFKPVRKLSNSISNKVETQIDMYVNAEDYYNENQALKKQITELYNKLSDYENVKKEIEELRKFVGIKEENTQYELSPPCSVIGRVTNDPFGSFIIDRGSKDDIKVYDPVVTGEGIVGIVVEVASNYSIVRTILSPEVSLGGLCVESRDTGIIEGSVDKASNGLCQMIYINKDNNIQAGNLIVTSGNSGLFPQNYIVGPVVETGINENGLTAFAVIKPAVDINKLTTVIVIKSMSSDDDSENGEINEN